MQKKYKVLRTIATIWKGIAWLVLVLGLLSSAGVLVISLMGKVTQLAEQQLGMVIPGALLSAPIFLAGILSTLFYFMMLYTLGELMTVFIAIEHNTRALTEKIQQPVQSTQMRPASAPAVISAQTTPPPPTYNPAALDTPPPPTNG